MDVTQSTNTPAELAHNLAFQLQLLRDAADYDDTHPLPMDCLIEEAFGQLAEQWVDLNNWMVRDDFHAKMRAKYPDGVEVFGQLCSCYAEGVLWLVREHLQATLRHVAPDAWQKFLVENEVLLIDQAAVDLIKERWNQLAPLLKELPRVDDYILRRLEFEADAQPSYLDMWFDGSDVGRDGYDRSVRIIGNQLCLIQCLYKAREHGLSPKVLRREIYDSQPKTDQALNSVKDGVLSKLKKLDLTIDASKNWVLTKM